MMAKKSRVDDLIGDILIECDEKYSFKGIFSYDKSRQRSVYNVTFYTGPIELEQVVVFGGKKRFTINVPDAAFRDSTEAKDIFLKEIFRQKFLSLR
jgi:hypothetical protein